MNESRKRRVGVRILRFRMRSVGRNSNAAVVVRSILRFRVIVNRNDGFSKGVLAVRSILRLQVIVNRNDGFSNDVLAA